MSSVVLWAVAAQAHSAAVPTDPAGGQPGWISRLATAPAKLAFWKKQDTPAPASTVSADTAPRPKSAKVAPQPAAKPPTDQGRLKDSKPISKLGAKPPTGPNVAPEKAGEESKKPGFLGRLWPGGDKGEGVEAGSATKEKLGPAKPEDPKKTSAAKSKTVPAASSGTAAPAKPSIWSRVASAVVPGKTTTPTTPTAAARGPHKVAALEPGGSTFVITKDESPFYTFGPHQATPPDAYLSTGTVVTVQEKSWGWAQVQLPDGRSGTIARNALRPATVADLVPALTPHSLMAAAAPRRVSAESYVMPPAAMPELPTGPAGPANSVDAEELSSALLPPFAE